MSTGRIHESPMNRDNAVRKRTGRAMIVCVATLTRAGMPTVPPELHPGDNGTPPTPKPLLSKPINPARVTQYLVCRPRAWMRPRRQEHFAHRWHRRFGSAP
jgi:hypothetical protein